MSDGIGYVCAAHSENECCCGADWRPKELIDLRQQLASRDAEVAELKKELYAISVAIDDPRTDLTMTMVEVITDQHKERDQLREQVKMLRDALGELVALKNLKDRAESAEDSSSNAYCGTEYTARKPAAWKSAKEALAATEPKP